MAAQIQSPLEIFLELDGTPLENGYIYIGESGKNAEASPITVYWDENYTIPAAQPIRTIGGYASRNGTRANVYVDGLYSMVTKNKNGALIFSGDSIVDPNVALAVTLAQEEAWNAEAEALTADSYATQTEDVFVNVYTSNGDGTFTATPTTDYSALHWAAKAGPFLLLAGGTVTGQIKGITPVAAEDLTRKDYVDAKTANITSGTNTPTATIVSNIDAIIEHKETYMRIGSIVSVAGFVSVDMTAGGTGTFELTLPIPSTFSGIDDLSGNLIAQDSSNASRGIILGGATNNKAFVYVYSTTTNAIDYRYTYQYEVI